MGDEKAPELEDICSAIDNLILDQTSGEHEVHLKQVSSSSPDPSDLENVSSSSGDEEYHDFPSAPEAMLQNETVVADYRAKLYRFESRRREWKIEGFGNIRILESTVKKNDYRVVMWLDGNGRVVCNFRLYSGFKVENRVNDPNTLSWRSLDFSDNDVPKWETFSCRFFMEEDCKEFKTKVLDCADKAAGPVTESTTGGSECSGCVGCDPDIFEFPQQVQLKIESVIDHQLGLESCTECPTTVTPSMFK